ncbi:MAG: hypothetical protein U0175_08505 [Caldilineaceae bacterium]
MIDTQNRIVQLCIEGSQAELAGNREAATRCYQAAWDAATNDTEACIAAHYLARFQPTSEAIFHWNQVALQRAEAVADERVQAFMPSLYLNMGRSYELLGNQPEAQRYYGLAAALGFPHQED